MRKLAIVMTAILLALAIASIAAAEHGTVMPPTTGSQGAPPSKS